MYINVDVDIDEFETCEICDELERRVRSLGRKKMTDKQKETLRSEIEGLYTLLNMSFDGIPIKSLNDKMKIDFIISVWDKYTFWELEKLLAK